MGLPVRSTTSPVGQGCRGSAIGGEGGRTARRPCRRRCCRGGEGPRAGQSCSGWSCGSPRKTASGRREQGRRKETGGRMPQSPVWRRDVLIHSTP